MSNNQTVMNTNINKNDLEFSFYPRGVPGFTYIPEVGPDGMIRWTNNGGLPNPDPVNIMGPPGPQGIVQFAIVDELPEIGSSLVIYLLRKRNTEQNLYDEYIWLSETNSFELIGKKTLNEEAQYVIGYYYDISVAETDLNKNLYKKTGEYAILIDENTLNKPIAITTETKVILKTYQTNPDYNSIIYQELINSNNGKKYSRTWTYENNQWQVSVWMAAMSGGIEISDNTPSTESAAILWVDTDETGEAFDPNNYYTKNEINAKIMNTLSRSDIDRAPSIAAVNNALNNIQYSTLLATVRDTSYNIVKTAYLNNKIICAKDYSGKIYNLNSAIQTGNNYEFIFSSVIDNENTINNYNVKLNSSGWDISEKNNISYTQSSIIDLIYPVGSIYLSLNNINPSTFWPNTYWRSVSFSSFYAWERYTPSV